jgi:hypothetical protein
MSTESIRQFPSTVSFDSPLQVPQLVEDQLSEDELERVVGGAALGNSRIKPPCWGGIPPAQGEMNSGEEPICPTW